MSVKLKIESSKGSDDLELSGGEEVADKVVKEAPSYPFGCHSGSCGVCRAHVLEGAELLESPGAVESETLERCEESNIRLVCRAKLKQGAQGKLHLKSVS